MGEEAGGGAATWILVNLGLVLLAAWLLGREEPARGGGAGRDAAER